MTVWPSTDPTPSSSLHSTQWWWASGNDEKERKLLTCHYGAKTTALCWMSPKVRSWLWTFGGHNDITWVEWDCCGEAERLQVPGSPHCRGSHLDYTHWHSGEEGEAAPLPPQAADEVLSPPEDPSALLHWCGGEHPDRKHIGTIGTTLPTLQDLYSRRCQTRACRIMMDPHHRNNKLFDLLQPVKRLRSHAARSERLKLSFFLQAIRTVNADLGKALPLPPPMHSHTPIGSTHSLTT